MTCKAHCKCKCHTTMCACWDGIVIKKNTSKPKKKVKGK